MNLLSDFSVHQISIGLLIPNDSARTKMENELGIKSGVQSDKQMARNIRVLRGDPHADLI